MFYLSCVDYFYIPNRHEMSLGLLSFQGFSEKFTYRCNAYDYIYRIMISNHLEESKCKIFTRASFSRAAMKNS